MMNSIRSRLALSFAGIALIAALALGLVLLAILRDLYSNLELSYLQTNTEAVGGLVAALYSQDAPHNEVQSQIENMAFLTQTRVQVFSSDRTLLYDSGSPQNLDVNLGANVPGQNNIQVAPNPLGGETFIQVVPNGADKTTSPSPTTSPAPAQNRSSNPSPASPEGSTFGLTLSPLLITGGARSNLAATMQMQAGGKSIFVRLSEGPAYGGAILRSVAGGWVFASVFAVLLAAAIGWFISRRISAPILALTGVTRRMAQGDLTGRAAIRSRDEFAQLARSFNEMADQVEATIATLRRFVTDAAHELRTPLTGLRINLDLASKEKDPTELAVFLSRAQVTARRLEELNTHLLDLSRLEADHLAGGGEAIDLTDILQQRVDIYASQAEQAGLVFEMELPPAPIFIRANSSQITRAMDNLVDNACKFTPLNGSADGKVKVTLSQEDSQAIFSVADTGIGIPVDELPQLFNRFHRARNTTPSPGSGLGLAIVKAVAVAFGGQVEVQSSGEGRGSQFTIRFPVIQQPLDAGRL